MPVPPDSSASASGTTASNSVNSAPAPPGRGGLPTAAIVGIAVGAVLAVVLAGAALAAALLRRPRHAGPAPSPGPELQPTSLQSQCAPHPAARAAACCGAPLELPAAAALACVHGVPSIQ